MKHRPAVALLVEPSNSYARGLLSGVVAFLREHQPWSLYLTEHNRGQSPIAMLKNWEGDGIIARVENQSTAEAVRASGLPVVDVSGERRLPDAAWVDTDDTAVAKLALEHFVERGFSQLAYCGDHEFAFSARRGEQFLHMAKKAGYPTHVYSPVTKRSLTWHRERQQLAEWIKQLPRPIGILTSFDSRGRQVLEVCRDAGIAVPDDIAVLGVDNDDLLCNLSDPPLSSVVPNTHLMGYTAAETLERMMRQKRAVRPKHRIKPLRVATRQSTDVLAVEDREVARAIAFIREHACHRIGVEDVARAALLSRSSLKRRFQKAIGHSVHDEIVHVRTKRIQELLTETDLPIDAVAERAGFEHREYMGVVFKQQTGSTPAAYRKSSTNKRP